MIQRSRHTGTSQRSGQMTAVMRAVAPTGPQVLRVGVVQGGQVREDRIIKERSHVTVGSHEKNTFLIAASNLPQAFRIFELIGADYHLNFLDHMTGRIALQSGISELSALKAQAQRTAPGAYRIRLSEASRGKVVMGDTTLLFQFVALPPIQPKAQLPVAVLRGAATIDWNTTIIAAVSFLVHFLVLGSIYSDWVDPVVDDEVSAAGAIDSLKALPAPPPVEDRDRPEDKPQADAQANKKAAEKSAPQKASGARASEKRAAALHNELESIELETLATLRGEGSATQGVLKNSEIAFDALDRAAASSSGVGVGNGDLKINLGGGAISPGVDGDLRDFGSKRRTAGTEGGGTIATVVGPQGKASIGSETTIGVVSNASQVVAQMRPAFRGCYQRYGLGQNPDAAGSIRLTLRVGPGGEVTGVTASASGSLPPAVVSCVQARASAGQFSVPEGGSAVVVVPVTFLKQ